MLWEGEKAGREGREEGRKEEREEGGKGGRSASQIINHGPDFLKNTN